jgi:TM2 domain-containing membrane protein YozV
MSILETNKPGVAAVLSLIIPGVGQFYNGTFWRGIFWLIITPGLWIGSGGMLGWICHIIAAITAYNYAKRSTEDNPESMPASSDFLKKEENFDILKDGKK